MTIYLSGHVDAVVSFLEANGGSPRNVGTDYIEAYVPVSLLGQTSQQPGVVRIREIIPPPPPLRPHPGPGPGTARLPGLEPGRQHRAGRQGRHH